MDCLKHPRVPTYKGKANSVSGVLWELPLAAKAGRYKQLKNTGVRNRIQESSFPMFYCLSAMLSILHTILELLLLPEKDYHSIDACRFIHHQLR
jgi:hypothetical protein